MIRKKQDKQVFQLKSMQKKMKKNKLGRLYTMHEEKLETINKDERQNYLKGHLPKSKGHFNIVKRTRIV